jgi:hypothetical protein
MKPLLTSNKSNEPPLNYVKMIEREEILWAKKLTA